MESQLRNDMGITFPRVIALLAGDSKTVQSQLQEDFLAKLGEEGTTLLSNSTFVAKLSTFNMLRQASKGEAWFKTSGEI
ncbi:hypothetical protein Prudu_000267 [Prunus dulcis]|uniref:Uncharacterized protein n=1 Tax=Prunus dulcis TaxID=3755 RepID=A0A4Y1QL03_PRUDU|nr:hypothetical protein Prudu_000267 [Prunus dulcis]